MKKIITLILVSLCTIALHAQDKAKAASITVKTSIFCDHCKKCPSCGKRLENAAYGIKGLKRIDVNEKESTLDIVYNPQKTSPEKIKEAIAKAGFDADDVKADAEAYAKLDDCCKRPE